MATGNIAVFFLIMFALSVPFVYLYLTCTYKPLRRDPVFSEAHVKQALDNFGTFLCHYAKNISSHRFFAQEHTLRWADMEPHHISGIAKLVDEMDQFLHHPDFDESDRKDSLEKRVMKTNFCETLTCHSIDMENNTADSKPYLPKLMQLNVNNVIEPSINIENDISSE